MGIMICADGPIDRYIREVGVSREVLENKLRAGDAGAMALYGAESVYRALGDLMTSIDTGQPVRRSSGESRAQPKRPRR